MPLRADQDYSRVLIIRLQSIKMDHAWSRPDGSDFPKIWLRQGGFVVRDVTADMDDYIIEHMVSFIVDCLKANMGAETDS